VISIVHQGTTKLTVLVRLAVRCALVALLCDAALAMARDGAPPPDNHPNNVGAVRQANVAPRTITLPVVDGKGKAQGGWGRESNTSDSSGAVQQARVNPVTVKIPIVDGTDVRFTRLSTTDGLSQRRVAQIVQDNQGFMWFGTQYGLNRYDGHNFKVFVPNPRNPNSLSGVFISALFKDRDGTLWVGCDQFLNKFEPATETFARYPVPYVIHISQDTAGTLWLATDSGLYSLDPATGRIRQYSHDPNDPSSLSSNNVKSSGEDKEGRFWVATSEGLDEFDRQTEKVTLHVPVHEASREMSFYEDRFGVFWIFHASGNGLEVLDRKTNTLTHYSFREQEPASAALTGVMAMLEDKNSTLWVATQGAGLLKFDRNQRIFIRYRNDPADPESLAQDRVISLFADREGSIWAGLDGTGPTRFATRPPSFEKTPHDFGIPNHKNEGYVQAIYEDRQGILWMGTSEEGLNRIDRKAGRYTSQRIPRQGAVINAITIHEDRLGNLWVGTYDQGLLRFDDWTGQFKTYRHNPANPYSLSNDTVTRLVVDHNGTLWAATWDGLNRFDASSGRFKSYSRDPRGRNPLYLELVEDREGKLWLGTHSSGLHRFDPATGQFTIYEHNMNRQGTLSDNRVNSVFFDHTGAMWVGTQNGLDKFEPQTATFTIYGERDGMAGTVASCILEDGRGRLWMSTNQGVSSFDPLTKRFNNYTSADGLPGADLTGWGACFKRADGKMFFGGFSGATAFYPAKVTDSQYVPPVVLTDFRLSGAPVEVGAGSPLEKSITYANTLTLSHRQNMFSLEFSALSYSNPATNRYRYKLEGLDSKWHEVGSEQRLVNYTTLPVGVYVFRVQGATSQGPWSEPGAALRIEILPPWWNTWWFRAIVAAALLFSVGGLYHIRVRSIEQRYRERELAAQKLQRSEAFLAEGQSLSHTGSLGWNVSTGEIYWSEETYKIFEYERAVKPTLVLIFQRLHPDDRNVVQQSIDRATNERAKLDFEHRLLMSDGSVKHLHVLARALETSSGNLEYVGAVTDVTERKRAEEERERLRADLSHVNRVSMLGELAASVSHELKQPITSAMTNARTCMRWLKRDQPAVEEALEATNRIVKDGSRATEIIERLRSLYKKSPPQRELVDVNEIVHEMLVLLQGEANRYSIPMRTELAPDLPKITADRVQLQQVFMNLMLNAIEAMKDTAGELTIKTELGQEGQLLISVSDTGVGLPKEKTEQIFNAFFTTKPEGSGMGLSISRSIVESHGGRMWAANNSPHGARFCFTLPTKAEAHDSGCFAASLVR
jgi:ligand-binding sensor domain-containing protein/signal transduction histidine kinase